MQRQVLLPHPKTTDDVTPEVAELASPGNRESSPIDLLSARNGRIGDIERLTRYDIGALSGQAAVGRIYDLGRNEVYRQCGPCEHTRIDRPVAEDSICHWRQVHRNVIGQRTGEVMPHVI